MKDSNCSVLCLRIFRPLSAGDAPATEINKWSDKVRELTMMEIDAVSGAMSNGEKAAMYGGIAAAYGGAAAIPTPLSPVLGLIGGASGIAAAYYTYMAL
jgi:hypothetical protein